MRSLNYIILGLIRLLPFRIRIWNRSEYDLRSLLRSQSQIYRFMLFWYHINKFCINETNDTYKAKSFSCLISAYFSSWYSGRINVVYDFTLWQRWRRCGTIAIYTDKPTKDGLRFKRKRKKFKLFSNYKIFKHTSNFLLIPLDGCWL